MPAVPVMPLGDDEHEILLVDDQVRVALVLFAIDVDAASMDTIGAGVGVVTTVIVMSWLADPTAPTQVTA